MKPSNHRIISLAAAIEEFKIESIFENDFEDLIANRLDEDTDVLVFDGDTEFAGDLNLNQAQGIAFGEPYNKNHHDLIIVNGNLKACNIHMWCVDGLLVFGHLTCEKIHLRELYPLYVQGNLVANQVILATADQEGHEKYSPAYVRVKGTTSSPRVQTWFMPLQHLHWTADSGKEYAEDKEDPQNNNWLSDTIWKF